MANIPHIIDACWWSFDRKWEREVLKITNDARGEGRKQGARSINKCPSVGVGDRWGVWEWKGSGGVGGLWKGDEG